jgi:hypothetical protein
MTEATARPWRVINPRPFKDGCLGSSGGYEISGWDGPKQLPVCYFYTRQKDYASWTETIEELLNARADAALIVKAVNHHDALVSALKGFDKLISRWSEIGAPPIRQLLIGQEKARSILSQVRAET